ncbi:uncharacterized protein KY384_001492 [Bacidia gigantensis]|uniref:uncharacterized protein n=1 Tax=Bacidia gigantensis TaxID=2732470 RepID=UPI001D05A9B7|nr:uncharacterized protein KY384_001492 [Bacidia gigantensis]KAG8533751.1 hypothetical protein KY384_001492 [Bacidia gigantensis]
MSEPGSDLAEESVTSECNSPPGGVRLDFSSRHAIQHSQHSIAGGVPLGNHDQEHDQYFRPSILAGEQSSSNSGLCSPFNPHAPQFISRLHLMTPPQVSERTSSPFPSLGELQEMYRKVTEAIQSQTPQKRLTDLYTHSREVMRLYRLTLSKIHEIEGLHDQACEKGDQESAEAFIQEILRMENVRDGLLEKEARLQEQLKVLEEEASIKRKVSGRDYDKGARQKIVMLDENKEDLPGLGYSRLVDFLHSPPILYHGDACLLAYFLHGVAARETHSPSICNKATEITAMRDLSKALAFSSAIKSLPHRATYASNRAITTQVSLTDLTRKRLAADPERNLVKERPLSLLSLSHLLRSYAITSLSSSPRILSPVLRAFSVLANSSWAVLSPDRNPLLHFVLKKTFYAHFCAGETTQEVKRTVEGLKKLGFKGVILSYGKEIVLERGDKPEIRKTETREEMKEVDSWREGTIKTVEMAVPGDFVALKFSGAGHNVMRQLAANAPLPPVVEAAAIEICELARMKRVRLLFDAEQSAVQDGIDTWTLEFQRRYNRGRAIVYGTYQAYLRSAPMTLARHLKVAEQEKIVLGVKLVRGAYMSTDPRNLFWASKEGTDKAYDKITEGLLKRRWNSVLRYSGAPHAFPETELVLASHNQISVEKAMEIRKQQSERDEKKIDAVYGQLMGMADEVSCGLILANKNKTNGSDHHIEDVGPSAYKYMVWGSVGDCLKYLVRRAEENRDAVTRAQSSRAALRNELMQRVGLS